MDIEKILKKCGILKNGKCKIEKINSGITNENYKVFVSGVPKYVVRLFGKNAELLGINRRREFKNANIAHGLEIAPRILFHNTRDKFMITEYIQGKNLSPSLLKNRKSIDALVRTIKILHARAEQYSGVAHLFSIIKDYSSRALKRGAAVSAEGMASLRYAQDVGKMLKKLRLPRGVPALVPSHLDLLSENIIFHESGPKLIDWEYSAKANPFFDIALLFVLCEFTPVQEKQFLKLYFGRVTPAHELWLSAYKVGVSVREAFWGYLQSTISQLDFDFLKYADKQIQRFREAKRGFEKLCTKKGF